MPEALSIEEANGVVLSTAKKKKVGGEGEEEDDGGDLVFSLIPMVRSRSQAGNRRVAPTCVATAKAEVEKKLPNGDLYIGSFSGGVPHGSGKYLWNDRCTYEGEWKRGKATGKGKFSWPSGATFVGEFRSGRMEGFGTFVGVAGDTYRGDWVADRKHGYGQKRYANGDFYEGTWWRNLQDGRGSYVWRNGTQYMGEWKNGVISGKGVLIWTNGDKCEGKWENGIPEGNCVFTWANGSSCAGNWNEEKGNILKIQLQEPNNVGEGGENSLKGINKNELIAMTRKRSSVEGGRGSLGAGRVFPKICIWQSDGEAGDITCDIIDDGQASMIYGEGFRKIRRNPYYFNEEVKKPGETISKGHKSYDWMLNLQLGIR